MPQDNANANSLQSFHLEALIWRNLNHQHILPFFGIATELFSSSPCMVSPWMIGGDIGSALGCRSKELSGDTWLYQILRWVGAIHTIISNWCIIHILMT